MGETTGIAWTDHTFNPWWGCVRVSPGCEHCYAEAWDKMRGGPEKHWGVQAPRRLFGDKHWNEPLRWNKSAAARGVRERVFCASMADVFEDRRDLDAQRVRLFALIAVTPFLDWQLLTKRPENMVRLAPSTWAKAWPANVWAGTTVEDQPRADERIPHLVRVPAVIRFLSSEPLLGSVTLPLRCARDHNHDGDCDRHPTGCPRVDWVIVGGESGGGARSMHLEWARSLVEQCKAAGVATFVKQLGVKPVESTGRCDVAACNCGGDSPIHDRLYPLRLDKKHGGKPEEWPADLRVREFPEVRHG
jgi:protein gp37